MIELINAIIISVCLMGADGNIDTNMVKLLQETCAVESDYGSTSTNIMQMTEATREDIITYYLRFDEEDDWFRKYMLLTPLSDKYFCVVMAKIHYLRTGIVIPDTRLERAKLWKNKYNTYLGKGTVLDYMYKSYLHLGREE